MQNSGPTFSSLWTKLHHIEFSRAGVSVVCNAVFRLTMSCCVPEIRDQIAKLPEIAPKFGVWGGQISGGRLGTKASPKFLTKFYKSGSPSNMWQSLVTIDQETYSEIRRRKKDLNDSGRTDGQHSWRAQRWKWVSGSWVTASDPWVTASDPLTHDEITQYHY